jgi:SAM-dependent methyltransferase
MKPVGDMSDVGSDARADRTFWEKVATNRWGAYLTTIERGVILRASQLAGPPRRAMDVGCEGGRWSALLARHAWEMICTDIEWDSVRVCQRRVPNAHCLLVDGNANTLPFREEIVNLILCIEVFNVAHSDWFFSEASRVLASGGVLVGVIRNRLSLRGVMFELLRLIDRRKRPDTYGVSYGDLRRKLRENGFVLKDAVGYAWSPFTRTSDSRLVPLCIGLEQSLGLRRLIRFSPWIIFIVQKT